MTHTSTSPQIVIPFEKKQTETKEEKADLLLNSGRKIHIEQSPEDSIRIIGLSGEVELAVRFTPQGPVLNFSAANIALESSGKVAISCEDFSVAAKQNIQLRAGKDTVSHAEGNHRVTVKQAFEVIADHLDMEAQHGSATIKANDLVRMLGEKILLNSDSDELVEQGKVIEFLKRLGLNK